MANPEKLGPAQPAPKKPTEWVPILQLVVSAVGVFLIGTLTLQLNRSSAQVTTKLQELQAAVIARTEERSAFVNLLDGIIDLKVWAVSQNKLMEAVAKDPLVVGLVKDKVVMDENDLMQKCELFFRLEKLYHLSRRSGIDETKREGLEREIGLWLGLGDVERFFNAFVKKSKAYSGEFIDLVDRYYASQGKLPN